MTYLRCAACSETPSIAPISDHGDGRVVSLERLPVVATLVDRVVVGDPGLSIGVACRRHRAAERLPAA